MSFHLHNYRTIKTHILQYNNHCNLATYVIQNRYENRNWLFKKSNKRKPKIDTQKCVDCGKCAELCPIKNLSIENNLTKAQDRCTMCYRCINICPKRAITLLGKKVVEQGTIEKYL
ncbi:MAG: 4Fe-4S binding protein [Lachnospiraceae bacterium]|nr:4Fe-4S binding protein [Lachnospiraceae bacterium]